MTNSTTQFFQIRYFQYNLNFTFSIPLQLLILGIMNSMANKRRKATGLTALALLFCSVDGRQAIDNQDRLYEYVLQSSRVPSSYEQVMMPSEDDDISLLQLDSQIDQKQHLDEGSGQQSSLASSASAEEQSYELQKEQHRNEVKAYKSWAKYSPFYLRHHPEAREAGDIQDIQQMSQKRSVNGDELAGVENVFEHNYNTFNNILSHSDASEQLAQVKSQIKSGKLNQQAKPNDKRLRKKQIYRVKKQIQKSKRKQRQQGVTGLHSSGHKKAGKKPPTETRAKQQMKQVKIQPNSRPAVGRKTTKILPKANMALHQKKVHKQQIQPIIQQSQPQFAEQSNDNLDQNDDQLFQSRQTQELGEQKVTISGPNDIRSFNSAMQDKDEMTGDYSKQAEFMAKPNRRMMDKIAQLETQVLAMGQRIQQLEIEKKEDEGQLQLLQTKVRHFEDVEVPADNAQLQSSQYQMNQMNEIDQDKDMMNIQLEEENVLLDAIKSIQDGITSLFTSHKDNKETNNQENAKPEKKETSLDRLNKAIKEQEEAAAKKLKEEQDHLKNIGSSSPSSYSSLQVSDQSPSVKDSINVQLTSNNEMHLLSELEAVGNLINKTREQKLAVMNKTAEPGAHEGENARTKSWAYIKAEARAQIHAKKVEEVSQDLVAKTAHEDKAPAPRPIKTTDHQTQSRPADTMNLQSAEASSQDQSEQEFEEQLEDDISLVGLSQQDRHKYSRGHDSDDEDELSAPNPGTSSKPERVVKLRAATTVQNRDDASRGHHIVQGRTSPRYQYEKQDYHRDFDEHHLDHEDDDVKEKDSVAQSKARIKAQKIQQDLERKVLREQIMRRQQEDEHIKEKLDNPEDRLDFEENTRKLLKDSSDFNEELERRIAKMKMRHLKDRTDADKHDDEREEDDDDDEQDEEDDQEDHEVGRQKESHGESDVERTRSDELPSPRIAPRPKVIHHKVIVVPKAHDIEQEIVDEAKEKSAEAKQAIESMKVIDAIKEEQKKEKEKEIQKVFNETVTAAKKEEEFKESIKDHIKKTVEETVKKEVEIGIKNARPNTTAKDEAPPTPEEKREDSKVKKIQNEIAREVKARGIDKKATREVEAREKQEELQKVSKKLDREISKHDKAEKHHAAISSELGQHKKEVERALEDTKRYRKENRKTDKLANREMEENRDEYQTQDDDRRSFQKVYGRKKYYYPKRDSHFHRDPNDDDNPEVPELSGPYRKGKREVEEEYDEDKPRLTKKESEDFDRLVKEAKEAKKKADEEKAAGAAGKDDTKDKKDKKADEPKQAITQMKHHHRHHHNKMNGYVQLRQEMQMGHEANVSQDAGRNVTLSPVSQESAGAQALQKEAPKAPAQVPVAVPAPAPAQRVQSPSPQPNPPAPAPVPQTQSQSQAPSIPATAPAGPTPIAPQPANTIANQKQSAPVSQQVILKSKNSAGTLDLVQKANENGKFVELMQKNTSQTAIMNQTHVDVQKQAANQSSDRNSTGDINIKKEIKGELNIRGAVKQLKDKTDSLVNQIKANSTSKSTEKDGKKGKSSEKSEKNVTKNHEGSGQKKADEKKNNNKTNPSQTQAKVNQTIQPQPAPYAVAEISEIDEDANMETEEDIVESEEQQNQDYKEAEMQEKEALETNSEVYDSFSSHTEKSLQEEQDKATKAEEMDEQTRLKQELEAQKKMQEELLKNDQKDKEIEKMEEEKEEKENEQLKIKKEKEEQEFQNKMQTFDKLEKEAKEKMKKEVEQLKVEELKNHDEIEKDMVNQTKKIEQEDKKLEQNIQVQEKLEELEEKKIERQMEREQMREQESVEELKKIEKQEKSKPKPEKNEQIGQIGQNSEEIALQIRAKMSKH